MDDVDKAPFSAGLENPNRRLEAILNNASVAIFLMDDRQCCIYMNRAAEEMTGFTLGEVLALDKPLHDIIHHSYPDGRPFPLSDCAIDRAFPEHNQIQGEETFVHRDGHFYPVAFTASPVLDDDSRTIGTIIEVRDVRQEKMAAERQRLLINELNHRVKNVLATVQSLAWQTLKGVDPDALERFTGRLFVLSGAHDLLTDVSWHNAGVEEVISVAIEPFGLERFKLEGPHSEVRSKEAVSLAMVLHELATNAVKYGALSTPEGCVKIGWKAERLANHKTLDIRWEEVGGPPVQAPPRRGFGTRLIERQLRLEDGGQASLEFRKEGVVCRMCLRLALD